MECFAHQTISMMEISFLILKCLQGMDMSDLEDDVGVWLF